jgi:hypothetical protein
MVALGARSADFPKAAEPAPDLSGLHDFDFQVGDWRVHHRVKRGTQAWLEFEGTCNNRPLLGGAGNVEDHVFNKPNGVTRGVGLRAYDPKSAQWAIWWLDSRDPFGALDPPVKGHFENGVGKFYADGVIDGKPVRTRFIWSNITPTAAHWEQALSSDGGKTWDTNWYMEFRRIPLPQVSPTEAARRLFAAEAAYAAGRRQHMAIQCSE